MNSDQVLSFVKNKVLSAKGICIMVGVAACVVAYNLMTARVIPMSYGAPGVDAVGANPMDLAGVAAAITTAIISFIASRFTGVAIRPEVVDAVVAFEKNPTSNETQRRLGAAIVGYLVEVLAKHPEGSGGFVLQLISTLVGAIDDPTVKNILNEAATKLATNQFKPVPVPPTA